MIHKIDKYKIDKYKNVKIKLECIIKNEHDIIKFYNVNKRINSLTQHVYQMLKLWIIKKYENNIEIPFIDKNLIIMAFKSIIINTSGPKPKGNNKLLYEEFSTFYKEIYCHLGLKFKIDGKNLSQIINYNTTEMITSFENNIKLHFFKYLYRYVYFYFLNLNKDAFIIMNKKDKKNFKLSISKIQNDLLNNTMNSHEKYHEWININRNNLLPLLSECDDKGYKYDICVNPQKYFKYMLYITTNLEQIIIPENKNTNKLKLENLKRLNQCFPLRTQIKLKHFVIDTKSIIEILETKNKNNNLKNIMKNKHELWNKYFNLEHKIFRKRKYVFDYKISTNCYDVSIQKIHVSYVEKENKKKNNKREAKKIAKFNKENNIIIEKQDKVIIKKEKKIKKPEFEYIDDAIKDINLKEQLKVMNKIYIDPGKKNLVTMIDDNEKKYKYTNKQYIHETKKIKFQNKILKFKKENNISQIEENITKCNSKSCSSINFEQYIKVKNFLNEQLFEHYNNIIYNKIKWYSYINKNRSIDKLINKIKELYGDNSAIIIGDWSIGKQMANFMPTPNISLKRKLKQKFDKIYNIDEFRTSMLNYKTESICTNIKLPDKNKKMRKIHSILTYQMLNKRIGCINRDWNAVYNMKKLTLNYLENNERCERYRRDFLRENL